MNATELFTVDGNSAGVYSCEKCRFFSDSRLLADQCCKPHRCGCGDICPQYRTVCEECSEKKKEELERARFASAQKITEWDGPVEMPGGDEIFDDTDLLLDHFRENDEPLPTYAWTCLERPAFRLDYGRIIEQATQELDNGVREDRLSGVKSLRRAIEDFNSANAHLVELYPNYRVAVLIPTAENQKPVDRICNAK